MYVRFDMFFRVYKSRQVAALPHPLPPPRPSFTRVPYAPFDEWTGIIVYILILIRNCETVRPAKLFITEQDHKDIDLSSNKQRMELYVTCVCGATRHIGEAATVPRRSPRPRLAYYHGESAFIYK